MKIKSRARNIKVSNIAVPPTEKPIKKDPEPQKKSNNFFGAAQSKAAQSKAEVTAEKNSSDSSKHVAKAKEEKTSPKNQSPKKNQPAAKQPQGKSSIASFFASKPATSGAPKSDNSISEATSKIESFKIKDEPINTTPSETKNSQKRPHPSTSGESKKTFLFFHFWG